LAYLFVTVVYLRAKKNFWCDVGTDTEEDPAVVAAVDRLLPLFAGESLMIFFRIPHNRVILAAGMFGEMEFRCQVHNDRLVHNGPQLGGSRTLRCDHYTHVGAVALHLVGRKCELGPFRVYHNPFAIHPLPPQWFQASGDRHFTPATEDGQPVLRWEERHTRG
jgi:hypothetical protein